MALSVQCFGGLRVRSDEGEPTFAYRKSTALVAYLATTGRPTPRAVLATLLWGQVAEPRARTNLRVVLSDVRAGLGEAVVAQGPEVLLEPAALSTLDTAAFEAAVGARRWEAAADLYRGPFLDGFFVEHAPRFEEWVASTREHYHRTAMAVLQELAGQYRADGDMARAVEVLGRMVALEPWHEHTRRRLMAALATAGDPDAALDEYRRLRRLLAEELDTAPEPETLALAERIAGHGRSTVRLDRMTAVPAPTSPIIGREDDVQLIEKSLAASGPHRLVTLTGPGGVGKTSLAREVAQRVAERGSLAATFVDLSGLTHADQVPGAIATAVQVPLIGLRAPLAEIAAVLAGSDLLLVLDNLEQLLPDGSAVVADLVARCPSVKVLATSRVRLGLAAERAIRVQPLALPPPVAEDVGLWSSPAVELFVRQAEAVGTTVGAGGMAEVAELCGRLEGLPLAIELAALHTRHLTVQEMLTTFGSTLDELDDTGVERPGRHRTLLDSVGWSYRLLDEPSQRLLRFLGVFRGGISLDVLSERLLADVPANRSSIVALLDAGLLDRQEVAGRSRLTMMASTQGFALRALDRAGETRDAAARHCSAHLALAHRADRELRGPDQVAWLHRLDEEADNMTAALRYAAEHDVAYFLRLANALSWFWNIRGRFHEGGGWLLTAIERTDDTEGLDAERAQALLNAGLLYVRRGRSPGGDELVDQLIERADTLLKKLGDEVGRVSLAHLRAMRRLHLGGLDATEAARTVASLEKGVALLVERGDTWGAARVGFILSALHFFFRHDLPAMISVAEASRARFEAVGDQRGVGCVLNVTGLATVLLGDVEGGRRSLRQALDHLRAVGDYMEIINSFHDLGYSYLVAGDDLATGARLLGAGARLCANSGLAFAESLQVELDRVAGPARERLGDRAWEAGWDEGWQSGVDVALPA